MNAKPAPTTVRWDRPAITYTEASDVSPLTALQTTRRCQTREYCDLNFPHPCYCLNGFLYCYLFHMNMRTVYIFSQGPHKRKCDSIFLCIFVYLFLLSSLLFIVINSYLRYPYSKSSVLTPWHGNSQQVCTEDCRLVTDDMQVIASCRIEAFI